MLTTAQGMLSHLQLVQIENVEMVRELLYSHASFQQISVWNKHRTWG